MPRFSLLLPILLVGCTSTNPSPTVQPVAKSIPPLTPERVNNLMLEVASLRGLSLRAPVPVYLFDEKTFLSALRERIGQAPDPRDQAAEEAFIQGFHLAPLANQRTTTSLEVLEEQVIAFYDRERRHIVVQNSQPRTKQEADKQLGTLAHEIEHALQDQSFPRPNVDSISGMDEQLAYRAVLEGDAMLAMVAFQAADHGIPFSRAIRRLSDVVRTIPIHQFVQSERGKALQTASPLTRERLLFPYHAGAGLVADLYRAGGLSLVNTLFTITPKSTEQVLHADKYLAGELPVPVKLPPTPPGARIVSSDTLGELQIRVLLSECAPVDQAGKAAAGWAGDRYTLLAGTDGSAGLLWTTTWDTEADAVEFVQTITRAPTCLGGGLEISMAGKNVGITRGLVKPMASDVAKVLTTLVADPPPAAPIGNYVIPAAPAPMQPEKGVLFGQTYSSRWLGITGASPMGFVGQIGQGAAEVRINAPVYGTSGVLLVSDKMTVPRFTEEVFQDIAQGFYEGSGGQLLYPVGGGPIRLPLGDAVERAWSIANSSAYVRAILVPVCQGTGSYVFVQSWTEPMGKEMLDAWMYSFRWTTAFVPPVCELLNPR